MIIKHRLSRIEFPKICLEMVHKLGLVHCAILTLFASRLLCANDVPLLRTTDEINEEGHKKLIQMQSQLPRYGECWKAALDDLERGCKTLTVETQSRMALAFTNCFLENIGLDTYECNAEMELKQCLKNIDQKSFVAYTEFFTHTQSICIYLQSQIWHEETSDMIGRLTVSSARVIRQLGDATLKQEEIISAQNQAIDNQQHLLNHGSKLNDYLEHSKAAAQEMFEEFKDSTNEQRMLITDVFDRVSKLQNFILDEFAGFYTVIYYMMSVIIAYLMTSSNRTSGARLWVFIIISLNFVFERYITAAYSELENLQEKFLDNDGPLYVRIWICRKVSSILCGLVLLYFAFTYQDLNSINNQLLNDIKKTIDGFTNLNAMDQVTQIRNQMLIGNHASSSGGDDGLTDLDEEDESWLDSDSDDSFITVMSTKSLPIRNTCGDAGNVRSLNSMKEILRNGIDSLQVQPKVKYNLRNRSVIVATDPVSRKERTNSFATFVSKMANRSQSNTFSMGHQIEEVACFSSDEDS